MEIYDIDRQATDGGVIQSIHFACWIPKATNTLSEYVILFFFTKPDTTVVKRRCFNITLYSHCLSY